jgi:hypothetical protein
MQREQPKPWPPPPDIESIRELVRAADPEGHLAEGAPLDEYEPEEDAIFENVAHLGKSELVSGNTLSIIRGVWQKSFIGLAERIEQFFGPEATPQVRSLPNSR